MWLKLTGVEPTFSKGPPKELGPAYYNFHLIRVFRRTEHGNCTVLEYSTRDSSGNRYVRESEEEIKILLQRETL